MFEGNKIKLYYTESNKDKLVLSKITRYSNRMYKDKLQNTNVNIVPNIRERHDL